MRNDNPGIDRTMSLTAFHEMTAQNTRLRRAARLLRDAADFAEDATDLLALQGWDIREFRALVSELRLRAERAGRRP